jgi:hypothetical protein
MVREPSRVPRGDDSIDGGGELLVRPAARRPPDEGATGAHQEIAERERKRPAQAADESPSGRLLVQRPHPLSRPPVVELAVHAGPILRMSMGMYQLLH